MDVDKLVPVPNDLEKLSNVFKKSVAKKTEYNSLKTKVDNIDTDDFVLKTVYSSNIKRIDDILKKGSGVTSKDKLDAVKNKIPNISGFLLASVFNSKIAEAENKIPYIKNLASNAELTTVENKIPDVSSLVTKTECSAEISKIKIDYVTNAALNARHKDLVQKTYFGSELKKVDDKVL